MKQLSFGVLSILALGTFLLFQNCNGNGDEDPITVTKNILKSKTWTVSSVVVPDNSATDAAQWQNFTVSFSDNSMITANHPTDAEGVWPSGSYTVSEDGKTITRSSDGVEMLLNPLTEDNFTAIFTIVGKNLGDARIASLDGDYRFNMK